MAFGFNDSHRGGTFIGYWGSVGCLWCLVFVVVGCFGCLVSPRASNSGWKGGGAGVSDGIVDPAAESSSVEGEEKGFECPGRSNGVNRGVRRLLTDDSWGGGCCYVCNRPCAKGIQASYCQ